ncbi:MAG: FHA domain-containing protein [Pseudomonadota bacterium]
MAKFIGEYVGELQRMGLGQFKMRNRVPVLIGIGVVGHLGERNRLERDRTLRSDTKDTDPLIYTASLAGRVWTIEREGVKKGSVAVKVGRSAENDIVVPEYSVSRKHCAFRFRIGGIVVVDLGSTNGTRLRDQLLPPNKAFRVRDGDELILGRYKFEFFFNRGFINRIRTLAKV